MEQIYLTPEEITVLYSHTTNGQKCLLFDIVPDNNGVYVARGIVEYYKENTRIEKFYFRVLPEPQTVAPEEDSFYFGTGSRLKFCGSSSGPLYKIGVNTWTDQSGAETYKTNINKENL